MSADRGSGTVLVVGVVAVVGAVAMLLGLLASAQISRARAQSAADLAALAGASATRSAGTGGAPCVVAADVVARNGAQLGGCRERGGAVVEVVARIPAGWGTATARAVAGPVSARGGDW